MGRLPCYDRRRAYSPRIDASLFQKGDYVRVERAVGDKGQVSTRSIGGGSAPSANNTYPLPAIARDFCSARGRRIK